MSTLLDIFYYIAIGFVVMGSICGFVSTVALAELVKRNNLRCDLQDNLNEQMINLIAEISARAKKGGKDD